MKKGTNTTQKEINIKQKRTRIEQLNEILYASREKVINILDWIQTASLWVAFGVLIYVLGFELESDEVSKIFRWLEGLITMFVIDYGMRMLYSFDKRAYIFQEKRLESFLVGSFLLVAFGRLVGVELFYLFFLLIGYEDYRFFYEAFLVLYLFILILTGIARASRYLNNLGISPATTFIFSFVILIFGGAGFLMLPAMTTIQGSMRFIDALFTSASAACVTGLAVQDTASFFTVKGQIVILVIIQLGGIGIVSFATFFATFLSQGVGLKQQAIIQDMLSTESLGDAKKTLRQVIFLTFLIEALGAVCLFFAWSPEVQYHTPIPQKELLTEIFLNKPIDQSKKRLNRQKNRRD
jgi:trk system potassium uptake protein